MASCCYSAIRVKGGRNNLVRIGYKYWSSVIYLCKWYMQFKIIDWEDKSMFNGKILFTFMGERCIVVNYSRAKLESFGFHSSICSCKHFVKLDYL